MHVTEKEVYRIMKAYGYEAIYSDGTNTHWKKIKPNNPHPDANTDIILFHPITRGELEAELQRAGLS